MAKVKHESTPHAKMLLVALRSVGYTNETAIADNGLGMTYGELMEAMEIGSADPNEMRPSEDLGCFGLGMKTAKAAMK